MKARLIKSVISRKHTQEQILKMKAQTKSDEIKDTQKRLQDAIERNARYPNPREQQLIRELKAKLAELHV